MYVQNKRLLMLFITFFILKQKMIICAERTLNALWNEYIHGITHRLIVETIGGIQRGKKKNCGAVDNEHFLGVVFH